MHILNHDILACDLSLAKLDASWRDKSLKSDANMKKTENHVSNSDAVTTEEMTDVIQKAQAECAEMRGITLSAIGKNIENKLARIIRSNGYTSRFDTAFELMCAVDEFKNIVKILFLDSFWLDDQTENVTLFKESRRGNKSEFMYVLRDLAGVCADIHDMIKGRC